MGTSQARGFVAKHRGAAGFAAGVLAASAIGGGVAIAAIPASNTGAVTACVKTTGAVRIIDFQAGKRCVTGERTIAWTKGYRYRGAWSATGTYAVLDVVTSGGSSYVAKVGSRGKAPATNAAYWGLLAAKGATGAPGAPGSNGTNGTNGTDGVGPGYSAHKNSAVTLTSPSGSFEPVAALTSLPPAYYVVNAKVIVSNIDATGAGSLVQCQLLLSSGDSDLARTELSDPVGKNDHATLAMQAVGQLMPGGSASVECKNLSSGATTVTWTKITAVRVSELTNTPAA